MKFFARNIYILFAFATLVGCAKGNLYIDNPDTAIKKIEVDGKAFSIEGKGALILESKPGQHRLVIKDENQILLKDTIFFLGKAGLIRLKPARYVKWRELYGDEKYRDEKLNKGKIEYETWVFTGDFTEYAPEQLYIEKDWDFDLDEEFPKEKVGWDMPGNEKYIIKSKIYRVEDFVKEIKK
jgi:hypothetical protein